MSTEKEQLNTKKTERDLDTISEKIKASKLKVQDIFVPLSVALILVLLTFFVFIPMITSTMKIREQHIEVKAKQEQLKNLEENLNRIDEESLLSDLSDSKEVIPRNLRVSAFIYYIDVLANQKNLVSRSISAADTQITIRETGDRKEDGRIYLGVSSPLTYVGSLDNILNFLDTLYSASPYIISIHNVALRGSEEDWRVTMSVRGYYIPDTDIKVDLYAPFEEYIKHESVLEIFRQKREQLR